MSFGAEVKEELRKLKLWNNNNGMEQDEQIKRLCIKEAFLEHGFINDPNKQYHMEIVLKQEKKAKEIQDMLSDFKIFSKIILRGKHYVVYIKDGEEIAKFLALIGASSSVLKFEEIRVIKDTRNQINRMVNCETANINKIVTASVEQIKAIDSLMAHNRLEELPSNLREIALLRKKYPDASLEELGKMLQEPIGKSGVYHRLQKIMQMAKEE